MGWSLEQLKALLRQSPNQPETAPSKPTGDSATMSDATSRTDEPDCPDVLLISVIGVDASERDRMLDWMIEDCETSGKLPIFMTDDLDLHPWLSRGLMVEHLPSMSRQEKTAPDLDWDLYLQRRLAFLKRKWQVDHIVDLGRSLNRLGARQETSPIDMEAAKRAVGGR